MKDFTLPLILLGYCFVTVMMPRLGAYDTAGAKFMALGVYNLIVFAFFMFRRELLFPTAATADSLSAEHHSAGFFKIFFTNRVGLIYSLFVLVSLLSFVKAINPVESLVTFTKLFTVFSSVIIVSAILRVNKQYLFLVAVAMSLLLLFDILTTFLAFAQSIAQHADFFTRYDYYLYTEIFTTYSNKNILTSAIFVKIPFTLWLLTFSKGPLKVLWMFTTILAVITVILMSTRAFYIGLVLLLFFYLLFLAVRFFIDKRGLRTVLIGLAGLILIPLFIYAGWFGLSRFNKSFETFNIKDRIEARMESIKSDIAAGTRISCWLRTAKLISEEPLLGVGAGNWKIRVLKYENPKVESYFYYIYTHNDFLEVTAETGIPGGLLFLMVFVTVWISFIKNIFGSGKIPPAQLQQISGRQEAEHERAEVKPAIRPLKAPPGKTGKIAGRKVELLTARDKDLTKNRPREGTSSDMKVLAPYEYLFLPAFGLLAYSVDAFFNFPFDRPEIQTLWILFIASAVTMTPSVKIGKKFIPLLRQKTGHLIPAGLSTVLGKPVITRRVSSVIYLLTLVSAAYLLYLNFISLRLQEVVRTEMHRGILTLPASKFMEGFPFLPTVSIESEPISVMKVRYLLNEKRIPEAITLLKNDQSSPYETRKELFLSQSYLMMENTDSALAYSLKVFKYKPGFRDNNLTLINLLDRLERYEEAIRIIDEFVATGFADPYFTDKRREFERKMMIQRVEPDYYRGTNYFDRKDFTKSADSFTAVISKEPGLPDAYEYRARCYYNLRDYRKSLADVEHLVAAGYTSPNLQDLQNKLKEIPGPARSEGKK